MKWLVPTLIWLAMLAFILVPFALFGDAIEAWFKAFIGADYGRVAIACLIFALLVADVVLPIPSSLVSSFSGASLGVFWGTFLCGTALTMGHCIGYRLGTSSSDRYRAWRNAPAQTGPENRTPFFVAALMVTRPIPVLAEAMTVQAGLSRLNFGAFLAGIIPGNFAAAAVYAYAGQYALDMGQAAPLVVAVMALPILAYALYAAFFKRRVTVTPAP